MKQHLDTVIDSHGQFEKGLTSASELKSLLFSSSSDHSIQPLSSALLIHFQGALITALLQPVYREHRKRGWGQGARGPLLRIPYSFPLDRSPTRPPRFLVGTSACVRVLCVSMCVCISLRCFRRGMPLQAPRATLTHSFTHSAHVPPCQSLGETDLHLHQTTQRPLR